MSSGGFGGYGGFRSIVVKDLEKLKSPNEGGTKKHFSDWRNNIEVHVTVAWKYGADVATIIRDAREQKFDKPRSLDATKDLDDVDKEAWKTMVAWYAERLMEYQENKKALFSLMMSYISSILRSNVVSTIGYADAKEKRDPLWLLEVLDDIMLNFEKAKSPLLAIDDQMERIMSIRQKPSDSNEEYVKNVMREIKVYEKHGGSFLWGDKQKEEIEKLVKDELSESDIAERKRAQTKLIKDRIAAMAILKRADKKRYGNLQIKLQNAYLLGKDEYPKSVSETLKLLDNYKQEWSNSRPPERSNRGNQNRNAVSFLQTGERCKFLKGTNDSFHPRITCHSCGIKGHYKSNCPVVINEEGEGISESETGQGAGDAVEEDE